MKKKINKKNSKNLWSGRFEESPADTMLRINSSISFDKTLYEKDISASKVHAKMLSNQSIITKEELKKILNGLTLMVISLVQELFVNQHHLILLLKN